MHQADSVTQVLQAKETSAARRSSHLDDLADNTRHLQMTCAQSHTRFGREDSIMAMALTKDEQLVLRYLASGRSIEEIAATLNWPLQAVRWTCTHPLIAWVLDELEASATQAHSPWAGREVSQGRAIVDYARGIARR
jgi:hypothetical protein